MSMEAVTLFYSSCYFKTCLIHKCIEFRPRIGYVFIYGSHIFLKGNDCHVVELNIYNIKHCST